MDDKLFIEKVISIGSCCTFNLFKKKYFSKLNRGPTHFFDWLICAYPNNIRILESTNIKNLLHVDNWRVVNRRKSACLQYNIEFNKSYLIKSLHDLTSELNLQRDVVDKYVRRHERLCNHIQNSQNLAFVYDSNLSDECAFEMHNALSHISPHKFIVILLCNDAVINIPVDFVKKDYIYRISFNLKNTSFDGASQLFKVIRTIYDDAF
jgi:hypothetical protein